MASLILTSSAKQRINQITQDNKYFRINIEAGGCAGYTHDFKLEDKANKDDLIIDEKVIVDSYIAFLLENSILDYVQDDFSAKFVLTNQEATSCGCGKSFNV